MTEPIDPTPEEIAAMCRAIRSQWSEAERERRWVYKSRPVNADWSPPTVSVAEVLAAAEEGEDAEVGTDILDAIREASERTEYTQRHWLRMAHRAHKKHGIAVAVWIECRRGGRTICPGCRETRVAWRCGTVVDYCGACYAKRRRRKAR